MNYLRVAAVLSFLFVAASLNAQTVSYVTNSGSCTSSGSPTKWDLHAQWHGGTCTINDDLIEGPVIGKILAIDCALGDYGPTWDIDVERSAANGVTCDDWHYVVSSWTATSCQKNSSLEFQTHTVCS
jgi:hypothetical protein